MKRLLCCWLVCLNVFVSCPVKGLDVCDFNRTGIVDSADFSPLLEGYGTPPSDPAFDVVVDNAIDIADIVFCLGHYEPFPNENAFAYAYYRPATGEISVTVSQVYSFYVESASQSLIGELPQLNLLPGNVILVTDSNTRFGFPVLSGSDVFTFPSRSSYSNVNFGTMAAKQLPPGDLSLVWNPQLGALRSSPLFLFGDFDRDLYVDASDAGTLFEAWGGDSAAADLNSDRLIDAADAGILFEDWTTLGSRAAVPEPLASSLIASLATALLARRRIRTRAAAERV